MSVSLLEVIEAGGYDLSTYEDAVWLKSKELEFEDLLSKAKQLIDDIEEKENAEFEAEYDRRMN